VDVSRAYRFFAGDLSLLWLSFCKFIVLISGRPKRLNTGDPKEFKPSSFSILFSLFVFENENDYGAKRSLFIFLASSVSFYNAWVKMVGILIYPVDCINDFLANLN
jgi:hypothetical protein